MAEYQRVQKLTREEAARARNSWWSFHAVECERAEGGREVWQGWVFDQGTHAPENIRMKASSAPLLSSNKTPLGNDVDKLQLWIKHFTGVVNCFSAVSQLTLKFLPVNI